MSSTSRKDSITSTSPIDGRYSDKIDPKLMELNSEFGLIKKRVQVEISWFKKLMTIQPIKRKYRLSKGDLDFVEKILRTSVLMMPMK
jgi:adenylosuccinate lyase